MINKIPIRIRLTIMTVSILVICCVGLTGVINFAASQMAMEVSDAVTPSFKSQIGQGIKQDTELKINMSNDTPIDSSDSTRARNTQKIVNKFYLKSTLYMIGIVCIGGIGTYYISGRVLRPLAKLNEEIQNRTVNNLSDKLEVPPSQDEISKIAKSFNIMTDNLNKSFAFQRQFSANAAHELRTPLTVLKAKIEVFNKKDQRSINEYSQLLSALEKQINRLSEIVQNLLDLTTTDTIIEKENISVSDIIDDIIAELSEVSKKKQIHFNTIYNDIEIYGNIDLLYQAFYNLIENSIKYNEIGGKVTILAEKSDNNIIIKISDTGIGIPVEMHKNIFEPFYRVDKSRSREIGGSGLGLSIVKNIITKHNGNILVSNNGSQGTCFSVIFPIKK